LEKALGGSEPGNKRKSDGSTKLYKDDPVVDFGKVTKDCSKTDICRLFLASLSLANAGNLLIQEMEGAAANEFRFEVLSDELYNVMEDYLAPSARA
jgi:Condensin II complex subunit CAP-H2 or CNDH2, C-term